MTTYTFSHLSVYIKTSPKTDAAFAVLKTALPQLALLRVQTQDVSRHKAVLESITFKLLKRQALLFTIDQDMLPKYTPKSYHRMHVETLEPVAPNITVLSMPIAHEDAEYIDSVIYGQLKPVLLNLFGRDLFKIVQITAQSDQSFYHDTARSVIHEQKTGWRRLLSIFQPH